MLAILRDCTYKPGEALDSPSGCPSRCNLGQRCFFKEEEDAHMFVTSILKAKLQIARARNEDNSSKNQIPVRKATISHLMALRYRRTNLLTTAQLVRSCTYRCQRNQRTDRLRDSVQNIRWSTSREIWVETINSISHFTDGTTYRSHSRDHGDILRQVSDVQSRGNDVCVLLVRPV